jgi:hypothetical protein
MKAVSSRSMPRNCPLGSRTPITRKVQAADAQTLRRAGSRLPNSLVLQLGAEHDEGARAAVVVRRQELAALHRRPEDFGSICALTP